MQINYPYHYKKYDVIIENFMAKFGGSISHLECHRWILPVQYLQNLLSLKWIAHVDKISEENLKNVGKYCHQLKSLEVDICPILTTEVTSTLCDGCTNLISLSLCSRRFEGIMQGQFYQILSEGKLSTLRELSIDKVKATGTKNIMQDIFTGCPGLKKLELFETGVEDILNFEADCDNLTELSFYSETLSDPSLQHLARKCTQLRRLELIYCRSCTDTGIMAFAKYNTNLETFVASSIGLSDMTLQCLTERCKNLRTLCLSSSHITDTGLSFLAKNCPNLEVLQIESCHLITNFGVNEVLENCFKLTEINTAFCKNIGDDAFRNAKNLVKLNVQACDISDLGLEYISQCENLQRLILVQRLSEVTVNGIQLLTRCTKLEYIDISNWNKSPSDISCLKSLPKLQGAKKAPLLYADFCK